MPVPAPISATPRQAAKTAVRRRRGAVTCPRCHAGRSGIISHVKRPAIVAAAGTFAVLLATSGRYGYHRDELYFLQAGRHLAWGYPDQPPLAPFVARVVSAVAPGSLPALRLPSALIAAAVVLLAGMIAQRLGARPGG